jgi:hypothetical protein
MNILNNRIKCETCGATSYERIVFEKPKRIAYLSDMSILKQNTGDDREQENICLECFKEEVIKQSKTHRRRMKAITK